MSRTRSFPCFLALMLAVLAGNANAAATSRWAGPHITGALQPGDFAQIQREWAQETFQRPLRLDIGNVSGEGLEMARLGAWLRERRPVIHLKRDCIHSCARDLLPAGRAWKADRGVMIGFSSMGDWPLVLKQALDDGQLFLDDQAAGSEVKARFVKQYSPQWENALAIQALRSGLPDRAQLFLDQLTRPSAVTSVTFNASSFQLSLKHSPMGCMAWLPDAVGLSQLGIDLPGYQPPEREEAAKRMKLPANRIYIGAMPDTPPTRPLCAGGTADIGEQAN